MLPRDFSRKWKVVYIAFLALLGIGAVIMKDYWMPGAVISSNLVFLMDPERSKTQKVAQLALFGIAIILTLVYFYTRIKTARQ